LHWKMVGMDVSKTYLSLYELGRKFPRAERHFEGSGKVDPDFSLVHHQSLKARLSHVCSFFNSLLARPPPSRARAVCKLPDCVFTKSGRLRETVGGNRIIKIVIVLTF
ncbi:unnamed protein product, partial [Allacma fusca]